MKQNLQHTVVVFILRAHSENERREKRAVFEHVLRTSTETTIAHLLENPTFGLRNVLNKIDQTGIGRLLILQVRKNGWIVFSTSRETKATYQKLLHVFDVLRSFWCNIPLLDHVL